MGTMSVSAEGLLCFQEAAVKRGPLKMPRRSLQGGSYALVGIFTDLLFSPPFCPPKRVNHYKRSGI